ncbi:transglutaminase-like cysteine peptidase [Cellvibrio sp. OA-2007]|uniref:transglutaminase-like cysteine peptidase n=1 Tax=Cellvibrio sp. OA-2007 TaxID=529823 RepID=UPI0009FF6A96|nr:transglutaminase-like cysteine peptidase [Cellvibrio sp. OA-2007]
MCRSESFHLRIKIMLSLLAFIFSLLASAQLDPQKMQQVMQNRYGSDGSALLSAWNLMLDKANHSSAEEKLLQVNQFFNRHVRYTEDSILWKKSDYWATPVDIMGMRAGDCEDYTIAKYFSLLQLGIATQQLRLIYVKAQIGGAQSKVFQAHMVLGYYPTPDAIPLILDSLINTIEPANKRPDLHPIFSFNSDGLWVGNQSTAADPTARLSRWRDLLARAKAEGF